MPLLGRCSLSSKTMARKVSTVGSCILESLTTQHLSSDSQIAVGTELALSCKLPLADGTIKEETAHKHLFLDGVFADSPARAKLTRWLGHSAQLGCGWCRFQGQTLEKATRFLGYSKEAKQGLIRGQPACRVGDSRLQLTHG